jgi:hypothetical protein
VRLIPALIGGARMPRRESLPERVQPIARRNALELSESRWAYDVGRLFEVLDELVPHRHLGGEAPAPPVRARSLRWSWSLVPEGMLVAGLSAAWIRCGSRCGDC